MSHSTESFFSGLFLGAVGFMMLLHLTGTTPEKTQRKIHQEAVDRGYGKWVIDQSSKKGWSPLTTFQWITNNISK